MGATDDIYDRKVNRSAMLRLFEKRTSNKALSVLQEHEKKVGELIKENKPLDKQYESTFSLLFNQSQRDLIDLVLDQVSFTHSAMSNSLKDIWDTRRPTRRIAEDIVLKRPLYSDVTLEEGWKGMAAIEKRKVESMIRQGISNGMSESDIATLIQRSSAFKITRNKALGLVRTGITSVTSQADREVYEANKQALYGWQYVAVLDSRTTPICASRDSKIYPVDDIKHLPPAHWHCRSTTTPVVKKYEDLASLESIGQIRYRNLKKLSDKQKAYYDGTTPLKESYSDWLRRQPPEVQLRHINDKSKLELFRSGRLTLDKFITPAGNGVSIKTLRKISDGGYGVPGDVQRFADAKVKLDMLKLGATRPEELFDLKDTLKEYFLLQSRNLDGQLSLTNYRGVNLGSKKANKRRVLTTPPTENNLVFNPLTGRYDDARLYAPHPSVYDNALRLVEESADLKPNDISFIKSLAEDLRTDLGVNETAVIVENLRNIISRFRRNKEPWANLKAVIQSQLKFDIMNISDNIETNLRRDSNFIKRLANDSFIDPVLGESDLYKLNQNLLENIKFINKWDDFKAVKLAGKLRGFIDTKIPLKLEIRLTDRDKDEFYLKFMKRLSLADSPDRDQLAVSIGRDLYNLANYRGSRNEWYKLGVKLLDDANEKGFFVLDTYGVQKRRMKSNRSGQYFGPYYDTQMTFLRIVHPSILEYAKKHREVDIGLRSGVIDKQLTIKPGFKTYFIDKYDTRIPITSTSSFKDFPEDVIDKDMANALNWAASTKYKVDEDFYDFIDKLLFFKDDKGRAKYFDELNNYRQYIVERGDSYERFKAMAWHRKNNHAFGNVPFLDHRARIYERGFIGPQSGEAFRPFLNTAEAKPLGQRGFLNLQDQIGSFIGGLSDELEGSYNSLSVLGRQKIAERWRKDLVKIGNHMLRKKPDDIRAVLESPLLQAVDGEEQGKLLRYAIEMAKIDNYLQDQKPLAIIVKGNPKYLKHMQKEADAFYGDIKQRLEEKGFRVEFDAGEPYTQPKQAAAWLGHSRGVDRLRFADDKTVTINIKSKSYTTDPKMFDKNGLKTSHYQLSTEDLKNISTLDATKVDKSHLLEDYNTSLALEQDASSSGAQIIALTTKNKQLAELSNVISTNQKRRLYDEIAAATFNDPRFIEMNKRLGLTEKDLRKAAKAQNMVTFYGAGAKTAAMNVEAKLAKVLDKSDDFLVVKASERDAVLQQISARAARYKSFDTYTYDQLMALRADVRDAFNKGTPIGDEIMSELWFLDSKTKDVVEKLSRNQLDTVTPKDFQNIARIMSEHLGEQVPILRDFSRYFGRLAETYLTTAAPKQAALDPYKILERRLFKQRNEIKLHPIISRILGVRSESVRNILLKRLHVLDKDSLIDKILFGVETPKFRRTGFKIGKLELFSEDIAKGREIFYANKMPKSWTSVPWVNFDGKVLEQVFTSSFEEKLLYKQNGVWQTSIIQVEQKTEPNWWEELRNKSGKFNDISDVQKARTAFGVNGNHSNDATLVKQFHLWGQKNSVPTSTVHDAFVTNAADMLEARDALRQIYASTISKNSLLDTLNEMRKRGLPQEEYDKYLNEAIDTGLLPVAGRSVVGGKTLEDADILKKEDILEDIQHTFDKNKYWYGIG